jgi:hypothetical protein
MAGRTKEQRSWDSVKDAIDPRLLTVYRIENLFSGEGMADVLGINHKGVVFWIENKALDDWPKRAATLPLRNMYEPGQQGFLRKWRYFNGHSFVLLRVDLEYFLLDPDDNLPEMYQEDVYGHAICIGKQNVIDHLSQLDHVEL